MKTRKLLVKRPPRLTTGEMTAMRRNALNDRIQELTERSVKRLEQGRDFEERAADMTVGTKVALALVIAHKSAEARREAAPVTNNLAVISVTPRSKSTDEWRGLAHAVDVEIEAVAADKGDK